MSQYVKLTLPDELARKIEERRGDQSMQAYILMAIRSAIYGSPVEAELRRQLAELLELIPKIGALPPSLSPPRPTTEPDNDSRMGW